MKQDLNVFSLKGNATFKGFIKNGLDSSVLINLIICFEGKFNEFKRRGLHFPPHLFSYHEVSHKEVVGVLINRYNFTKEDAIEAMNKIIQEFDLDKIQRLSTDQKFEELVQATNESLVHESKDTKLKIGQMDIIIIAGFLREKINFIHSGDRAFLQTCERLGMNTVPIPERDREKEEQMKKGLKEKN